MFCWLLEGWKDQTASSAKAMRPNMKEAPVMAPRGTNGAAATLVNTCVERGYLQQVCSTHNALSNGLLKVVHLHQQLLLQLILPQLHLIPILAPPTGLHHCPCPCLLCKHHMCNSAADSVSGHIKTIVGPSIQRGVPKLLSSNGLYLAYRYAQYRQYPHWVQDKV